MYSPCFEITLGNSGLHYWHRIVPVSISEKTLWYIRVFIAFLFVNAWQKLH